MLTLAVIAGAFGAGLFCGWARWSTPAPSATLADLVREAQRQLRQAQPLLAAMPMLATSLMLARMALCEIVADADLMRELDAIDLAKVKEPHGSHAIDVSRSH